MTIATQFSRRPEQAPLDEVLAVNAVTVSATAGQRAWAYFIDIAIVAVVVLVVWFTVSSLPLVIVTLIELWLIGWIAEGSTGATPGSLILGLRTVRSEANVSVGARRLFPRSLALAASHIIPVLLPVGLVASGVLDGLSRARVIDVRAMQRESASGASFAPDTQARVTGEVALTSVGGALTELVTHVPRVEPVSAAVAHVPEAPVVVGIPVFELSDGTVVPVTGLGYIGRAPRAPESIDDAILVRVPDGARLPSRTHAAFGVEDGQVWVQDLASANGLWVRHSRGGVSQLGSHEPYFLRSGDVLVLGGDAEIGFRFEQPGVGGSTSVPGGDVAGSAPVVSSAVQSVIALQLPDGTAAPIAGLTYIGRAPRIPANESPDVTLISVPEGDLSISRTHGRCSVVDGMTWFEDLGSGNGSELRLTDGSQIPLTPHQRYELTPGMTLLLGGVPVGVVVAG